MPPLLTAACEDDGGTATPSPKSEPPSLRNGFVSDLPFTGKSNEVRGYDRALTREKLTWLAENWPPNPA